MAKKKIKTPATLSSHFGIEAKKLRSVGVLNPTLGVDTKLFIDPLLLEGSSHREMSKDAVAEYNEHFSKIAALLAVLDDSKPDSAAWRSARRLVEVKEVAGTCLGYGAASIRGSAIGPSLGAQIIATGREIVALGVKDPLLFAAMALFEEDIGPDRISDMTTSAIRRAIVKFNKRVLKELGLSGTNHVLIDVEGEFLANPFSAGTPIVLLPSDVLRVLPVANDWDEVADVAKHNQALRARVNDHVGHLFAKASHRKSAELRAQVLASSAAFKTLLDVIRAAGGDGYDLKTDPLGLLSWAAAGHEAAERFPIKRPKRPANAKEVHAFVDVMVDQFRTLIEDRGLNKELFTSDEYPRHEITAQRLFFAVAYAYCKANDVDITPEAESGNGPVDFKMSTGFAARVLVEIKLSTNSKVVDGYRKQLDTYKAAEETEHATYLVIDVGSMEKKQEKLRKLRSDAIRAGEKVSRLEFVDGTLKPSASKR